MLKKGKHFQVKHKSFRAPPRFGCGKGGAGGTGGASGAGATALAKEAGLAPNTVART